MSWSRLPPPPRRRVACNGETRRSCGEATPSSVVLKMAGRRSRAAEFPHRDAEPLCLVGKVVLDSRAREMHDADRQQFEHGVVALEGRCLGMFCPVRLESDLWHLPAGRPFGGDQFCALWRAAMDQHHIGMLGTDLV